MQKLNPMFILERLISAIAPHVCLRCGAEGAVVCDWCLPDFATPLPARCYRCKVQTQNSLVCKKCRHDSRLKHVWVRTGYERLAKQLIRDFKFGRKQAAAQPLACLTGECLPFLSRDTVVTHVPTATTRIRQRGYDHAQLFARALARECNLPYVPLLARTGKIRQVGSTRKERLTQLDNAFTVARPAAARAASILIVDDIVTTGGTIEAVARTLRRAGAAQVDAVLFAQKD